VDTGEGRKHFFFEKTKQKTFARLNRGRTRRLGLNGQKFFGSFFQKRTASLALALLRPAPRSGSRPGERQ
jgi:hypothetical protein